MTVMVVRDRSKRRAAPSVVDNWSLLESTEVGGRLLGLGVPGFIDGIRRAVRPLVIHQEPIRTVVVVSGSDAG